MQTESGQGSWLSKRPTRGLVNIQVTLAARLFLERRGARSHRGGSVFSRSSVLNRQLELLKAMLEAADPRPLLARPVHEAAVTLLARAWTLKPLEVAHLEEILAKVEGLDTVLAAADIERQEFLAAIAGLTFWEKCALVDLAVQSHAPGAALEAPE